MRSYVVRRYTVAYVRECCLRFRLHAHTHTHSTSTPTSNTWEPRPLLPVVRVPRIDVLCRPPASPPCHEQAHMPKYISITTDVSIRQLQHTSAYFIIRRSTRQHTAAYVDRSTLGRWGSVPVSASALQLSTTSVRDCDKNVAHASFQPRQSSAARGRKTSACRHLHSIFVSSVRQSATYACCRLARKRIVCECGHVSA
jgi:hypothetical protein